MYYENEDFSSQMYKYIDNLIQHLIFLFPLALSVYVAHESQCGKTTCVDGCSTSIINVLD